MKKVNKYLTEAAKLRKLIQAYRNAANNRYSDGEYAESFLENQLISIVQMLSKKQRKIFVDSMQESTDKLSRPHGVAFLRVVK